MNAREAKATAVKRAAEIKNQREEAARKRNEAAALRWKEERANWLKGEIAHIETSILEAADKGKTSVDIWLATSDKPEQAKEKAFWEGFAFEPELKKVIAHFKKLDYTLEFTVKPHENIDLSDLNPRDNWFTYETILKVSWQ